MLPYFVQSSDNNLSGPKEQLLFSPWNDAKKEHPSDCTGSGIIEMYKKSK